MFFMDVEMFLIHYSQKRLCGFLLNLSSLKKVNPIAVQRISISTLTEEKKEERKSLQKFQRCVTPAFKSLLNNRIESIVGIKVGNNITSWALLSTNRTLLKWDYCDYPNSNFSSLYNSTKQISEIVKSLPVADVYVIEEKYIAYTQKKKLFPAILQEQQLIVATMACLTLRNENLGMKNTIVTLKSRTTERFLGLTVGDECVSTLYIMKSLLDSNECGDTTLPRVNIPNEFKEKYYKETTVKQEAMNWSLMTGLTFVDMYISLAKL